MVQLNASKSPATAHNALNELGFKIFLDRYAQKDMTRETLAVGDLVIVVVDSKTGQREIGRVTAMALPKVTIELLDGEVVERDVEHVDKPLETEPGQMMDRVARGIAAVEKNAKQRKDWEKKFRWLLDDFKFVPAGRILAAAGTDQELTFYNCMPPEQEILTADGYKPIGDVRVGDLVVTHKNRLRPVLTKFERETEEPVYVIQVKKIGYDALRVTGEHKVYAIRSEWIENETEPSRVRSGQEPEWIPAKELKEGDYLAEAYDGTIDESKCYAVGWWIGNGKLIHNLGLVPPGIVSVSSGELWRGATRTPFVEQARSAFETIAAPLWSVFGAEYEYTLSINAQTAIAFDLEFGHDLSKRISDEYMRLPSHLTRALLTGFFASQGQTLGSSGARIYASNRTLKNSLQSLLERLGYSISVEIDRPDGYLGIEPSYFLTIRDGNQTDLVCGGLTWLRIDQIAVEDYSGIVMDIEVEEDHSFVSAGVVVSNCYVIPSPKDSRGGIIQTLSQMTEIMSRGGGVGINISTLRPRHAYVKGVNGRSSGSVSWGALYSFVTGLIEQGGSRRGALMLILNDWHPDVYDFINSKREAGKITNANISVGISDRFMEAVKADGEWDLLFPDTSDPHYNGEWEGDLEKWIGAGHAVVHYKTVKARDLWNTMIESAWASAEPGVFFRERYNKMSNSAYFAPIICTNPCITGDTRIYTAEGMVQARELFDSERPVDVVVDGRFGVEATTVKASRVILTGHKPVYRLQTKEGYYLRATSDHRVMTSAGWVQMGDLKPGDRIHILNRKGGFGTQGSLELGRVLGWTVGDGLVKSDAVVLSFFGDEKRELSPMFADYVDALVEPLTQRARRYPVGVRDITSRDEARVQSNRLRTVVAEYGLTEDKFRVPDGVFKGTEDMQRGFLQALFTADGTLLDGGEKGGSVRLASNHITLLEGVQQLLLNFGVASRIYRNRRQAGFRMMPDSNREPKSYWCDAQHELAISKRNMAVFADEIGFILERKQNALIRYIGAREKRGLYGEKFTAVVENVTPDGVEDVFDLNEPTTHSFLANGTVVHNCGEQGLPAFGVCNLGAINLSKFYNPETQNVDWQTLDKSVRYATRFLDNVIDATPYFFEENERQQKSERRVGLNNMGLAELMIKLGIRYGSDESLKFIDKLFAFIARASYETSIELAQERGAFPQFDGEQFVKSGFMQAMPADIRERAEKLGIRNVTLLTQAPTGTTGTMVNTSTGIEPFFSWKYYRKSRLGLHEENARIVQDWFDTHPGAKELPDYFVTAMELSPEEHVRVQGAIQRWVDAAISKTANVPNSYTVEQTRELYEYMYELGCKGGTIYRDGSRSEQVLILKEDEDEKQESAVMAEPVAQVATPHRVYPRPNKLQGVTVNINTPYGRAYITMNSDELGYPFEVFIVAPGKAGSDLQADAEGLGRMISLQLRTTAPENRMQMLRLVIDQLQGIGGSRSVGFGPNRIMSLPDAVALALMEHYFPEDKAEQLSLFQSQFEAGSIPGVEDDPAPVVPLTAPSNGHTPNGRKSKAEVFADAANGKVEGAEMCPSCHNVSLVRAEGCKTCLRCGFSEC